MSEIEKGVDENYDWLTETLFESIIANELSDCARNEYELKLTSIKPAVGKGENYIAQVTRVELKVNFINSDREPNIYNFFVKSSLTLMKEFEEIGVFEKEINFYEQVVSNFRKIDDRQIIIMDDLSTAGYQMQDRLAGLDFDHCKLFYKTIAQFHAISAVHYERFGRYAERFHQPMYRMELKPMFDKWGDVMYNEFLQIFDRYESLKPYREKFIKWKDSVFEAVCEIMEEKPDEFNVLNHGDAWVNNMLFRHDADNKPTDLCFVDFQISVYGTPMTDILYFFASSPTLDVRENDFDELLHVYHTNLVEHLRKHNYPKPIPTMRDLQMMVLKHGLLGSYFLNGIAAVVLLDTDDTRPADFFAKEGEEGDSFRYNLYNSPRYIKALEVALKFFDRRGLLEY